MSESAPIDPPRVHAVVRWAMAQMFRLLGGHMSVGVENVPPSGPALLCPNHISDCDPIAVYLALERRDVYFMAKEEFFTVPVLKDIMRIGGAFPVKRDSADRTAIRRAQEILKQGSVLVLFPEGRLSESGELGTVQPGAAMVALHAGAPIVPVGLIRTNWFLPYGHIIPRRSRMAARVVFGKPIETRSFQALKGRIAIDKLTETLERDIRELTGQEQRQA